MAVTAHTLRVLIGADASGIVTGLREADRALDRTASSARRTNTAVTQASNGIDFASLKAAKGFGRVNDAALTVVRSLTGLPPIVARLTDVFSTMWVGAAPAAGVFLGIAAISLAYRKLTQDARDARDATNELVQKLNEAANARLAASPGGLTSGRDTILEELSDALRERSRRQQTMAEWETAGPLGFGLGFGLTKMWDERKLKQAEERVQSLTRALYEQNRELEKGVAAQGKWWEERQTLPAIEFAVLSTERMREAARATEDFTRALARLNDQAAQMNAAIPDAVSILSGALNVGVRTMPFGPGSQAQGVNPFARYSINAPSVDYLRNTMPGATRIGRDLPGTAGGGSNWGQAAQIAGGMILGTGLAGDGYAAAGLGGGISLAAQGAMLGSVVPGIGTAVGAVVGAVGGLVSGLFGHSKKVREEEKRIKEAQKVFDANLRARKAAADGDTERAEQLRLAAMHEKELAEARAGGMSKTSIAMLRQIQYEEKLALIRDQATEAAIRAAEKERELAEVRERQVQFIEDLAVRALRATGQTDLADTLGLQYAHRRQMNDARAAGTSAADLMVLEMVQGIEAQALALDQWRDQHLALVEEQVDAIDRLVDASREEFRVAQDQLRVQERTVESLRSVVDSLTRFGDNLKIGGLSPLTPTEQVEEARRQRDMLANLARGGDASAAASLPEATRALLDLTRTFFGTATPGYVKEFERSQQIIEDVRAQFQNQLSIEERILAELQKHTNKLEKQVQELQAQQNTIRQEAANQVAAINATHAAQMARLAEMVLNLFGINKDTGKIADNTGTDLIIAKATIAEYNGKILPDLHSYYTSQLSEKDAFYQNERARLIDIINGLMGVQAAPAQGFAEVVASVNRVADLVQAGNQQAQRNAENYFNEDY